MMRPDADHDLSWTAFRYVAGELADAEASAFEARLLDDQAAREAVALAVELFGAVALVGAEQPPARPVRPAPRRLAPWAALAAAAAVVVAATLTWSDRAPGPEPDPSAVVSAWSDPDERPPIEAEADDLAGPIDAEPATDRPLPSWLLAGASEPSDDSPRVED